MYNIIISNQSATVIYNGHPYTVDKTHSKYEELIDAYRNRDEQRLVSILAYIEGVRDWSDKNSGGKVEIRGRKIYYDGELMNNAVAQRILEWDADGLDPAPMMNFLEKLMDNPSYQSREELLLFLENGKLPIQDDGTFIAYKVVRGDYLDKHTGKIDNSIGTVVEMPRSQVDDNRRNTCSTGLHFCSKEYLKAFKSSSNRLMLLAVNPADVVSIPYDYNNAKGRACRYKVIGEVKEARDFDSQHFDEQPRDAKGRFVRA